jgi:hypothetical protein
MNYNGVVSCKESRSQWPKSPLCKFSLKSLILNLWQKTNTLCQKIDWHIVTDFSFILHNGAMERYCISRQSMHKSPLRGRALKEGFLIRLQLNSIWWWSVMEKIFLGIRWGRSTAQNDLLSSFSCFKSAKDELLFDWGGRIERIWTANKELCFAMLVLRLSFETQVAFPVFFWDVVFKLFWRILEPFSSRFTSSLSYYHSVKCYIFLLYRVAWGKYQTGVENRTFSCNEYGYVFSRISLWFPCHCRMAVCPQILEA